MTSNLDILAAVSARLFAAKESGKIKPSGDGFTNIVIDDEHSHRFDIHVYMEKRATLLIHVIRIDGSPLLTSQKMVGFLWPHKADAPAKPSYNAGDAALPATLMYSGDTAPLVLFAAVQYLIDGWLDDTNPAHMWAKMEKAGK